MCAQNPLGLCMHVVTLGVCMCSDLRNTCVDEDPRGMCMHAQCLQTCVCIYLYVYMCVQSVFWGFFCFLSSSIIPCSALADTNYLDFQSLWFPVCAVILPSIISAIVFIAI